jgi:CheY-like chemotaxis protein
MATILVVDDSAMDRRLAGRLLEKNSDWQVVYASDGAEAFSQLELHLPDLVLTDMQMPEMNGLELVNGMKEDYPLVPVVLMTAQGSETLAVEALQTGAASYVMKSELAHDLLDIVARVLAASNEERNQSRLMHRMTELEARFVLENDLTLIPPMVAYLQQVIISMRFGTESERLRVGVALEEALLNSYFHGNLDVSSELRETDHTAYYELARQRSQESPYRERKIAVNAQLSPNEAVYTICDGGQGFDPSTLPDATDPANLERPCGRGLLLMRTFMDDVSFNEVGNEVTMVKRR